MCTSGLSLTKQWYTRSEIERQCMKVVVIGTGFVGVVSAAVFASFGNEVVGIDIDPNKIAKLQKGEVPFFEPGLTELLVQEQASKRLSFTTEYEPAVTGAQVCIIAVGTPSGASGRADLSYVYAACESLAPHLEEHAVVVVKSTVPPGTLKSVHEKIAAHTQVKFSVASVPEFLREGTAVYDTLHPDRVVIGAADDAAYQVLAELHKPLSAPVIRVVPESAQMGKYAANSYLALRIAFINQIADICEHTGADVSEVIAIIGKDKRIGDHYWYPGPGYGGSCFPKDVKEIAEYSKQVGETDALFIKLHELNEARLPKLLKKWSTLVGGWKSKKVAVLGLSFKPETDDLREAPSLKIIPKLLESDATVVAFDPQAAAAAGRYFGQKEGLTIVDNIDTALTDADVIIILTEWTQITGYVFKKVEKKTVYFIDSRNQFDGQQLKSLGYTYIGIGKGTA